MERRNVSEFAELTAYDALQAAREHGQLKCEQTPNLTLSPQPAYDAYHRIHKVFVGEKSADLLETISQSLRDEQIPEYLNVSAWSAAEAALVEIDSTSQHRTELLRNAEMAWKRAIQSQETINHAPQYDYMREDAASYRYALSIAFLPLMQSIVERDVSQSAREVVFADVIAVAQSAGVQRHLAYQAGDKDSVSDFLGFEHECNALLSLLHMDDPRYIPLPSLARSGSGYDYPEQTHDITVVNQHWGRILKVTPVEIKSAASLHDLKRYQALIIRGKMHLSVEGKYMPEHTRGAFARSFDGSASQQDKDIASRVTACTRDLLQLYQKGQRRADSDHMRFHELEAVSRQYPEFRLDRAG